MDNRAGNKHVAIFTKDIPIAATDGSSMLINPDTYFKFNLNQRVFVAAHEILHCILRHCEDMHRHAKRGKVAYKDGVEVDYDQQIMNQAADLVINDMLVTSGVGEMPPVGLHDKSLATGDDSVIDVYRKIYKKPPPHSGSGGKGSGFDQHLAPGTSDGKDANQAVQDRSDTAWKTAVASAVNAARIQGKLPAGLARVLEEVLNPQVDWREHIKGLFARRVGTGSYDWRKPDRRLIVRDIYAPGRSGFGAGTVVIGVDTSGSIGKRELDMFLGEVAGILDDVRPQRILMMWCDAKVHRVDEANEAGDLNHIRAQGAPGGGGTSFVPVFSEINSLGIEPDALVYLTDGYGDFPKDVPSYPVIWGDIEGKVKFPWGDVVVIPKQAA